MKPPIIITEKWDISVHPSAKHAETFLEVVDVRGGIYTAYDSNGILLELIVVPQKRERRFLFFHWLEFYSCVVIQEVNPKQDCSGELREKLVNYLRHRGLADEKLSLSSLKDLIAMIVEHMPWRIVTSQEMKNERTDNKA